MMNGSSGFHSNEPEIKNNKVLNNINLKFKKGHARLTAIHFRNLYLIKKILEKNV